MAKQKTTWGAEPGEWDTFIDLGLGEDLLPVVSNSSAEISPNSNMKQAGKTPSVYNHSGYVVGLPKWTERKSSDKDIAVWRKQDDYGICVQTRYVRGIDIDIDDRDMVTAITEYIQEFLGVYLPLRHRDNSEKCLLAVIVEGDIPKETLKFGDAGMVEFLGNGQQFIAAGTHPSGARYEWSEEIDEPTPVITQKEYEALIYMMEMDFDATRSKRKAGKRKRDVQDVVTDSTVQFLEERGHVLDYGPEGEAHIDCPFKEEHTTDSVVSATTYFPAGSRGYDRGHFVCLHAHCEGRTDTEFMDALGVREADFEVVEIPEDEYQPPEFERDKHGRPKATITNVILALDDPHICNAHVCYDSFRDEIVFYSQDRQKWERENDERFTIMRSRLESKHCFHPVGREMIRDASRVVAKKNSLDTAMEWLKELEWDGVPRIDNFVHDYLGADDTEYTRAVSRYIWTAAAGRILDPGLKADMIPIMKGPQGYLKSTAIAAMAPNQDAFCEIDFDEKDDDLARKMRGVLVCEIPELRGLRTRAVEAIKAFVARTHEKWIPKYKEFSTSFPRRCIFIATTNDDEFLADSTGNRRWLPFEVKRKTDVAGIVRDKRQLWAEARERYKEQGLLWSDAEVLAVEHHEQYMMRDAWYDVIVDWMGRCDDMDDSTPQDREYLRVIDVGREALHIDPNKMKRLEEMRIADVLRTLGYEHKRKRVKINGEQKQIRAWFPPLPELA